MKWKPYFGCNFIQAPIATASLLSNAIINRGGDIADIVRVRIITSTAAREYPGCNYQGPFRKVQQSKMSVQYGVAAALLFRGRMYKERYVEFENEDLMRLIQACVVETDPGYDTALSLGVKQPCQIVVQMENGTVDEKSLDDVPWFEAEAVKERCKTELWERLHAKTAKGIFEAICEMGSKKHQSTAAALCVLLAVPGKV